MIAALYVDPRGAYAGLDGVEVWDEAREGPPEVIGWALGLLWRLEAA